MLVELTPVADAADLNSWAAIERVGNGALPLVALDLRTTKARPIDLAAIEVLTETIRDAPWVTVAAVDTDLPNRLFELADSCDIVVGEGVDAPTVIAVDSVTEEVDRLAACVAASPTAAVALAQLLRLADQRSVAQALHAESLTYGLLQTSDHYQRWLGDRRPKPRRDPAPSQVVAVHRSAGLLTITLNRAEQRNALNVAMRDQLVAALELLDLDASLDGAVLRGAGPSFCAGGDLDEFGSTPSAAVGHRVRTVRGLPRLIHRQRHRIRVHLHGACVGAGIELPAFAHAVLAHPDTTFRLPEVGFGLVPGAGGTVSVSRRCGRQRTAWWAITGERLDATTALAWNLIDRIDPTIEPA